MKKVIRLSEADLTRIVKRVIRENNSSKFIYEDYKNKMSKLLKESAEALVADAKKQMASGQEADPDIKQSIIDCINKQKLTNLSVLTAGSGAYLLGLLALMLGSGVGAPLALMASGAALILADGLGYVSNETLMDEINSLLKCMGY